MLRKSAPSGAAGWPLAISAFLLVLGASVHLFLGHAGASSASVHRLGHDDAYISYRYAENLAAGHGLVFNPGEEAVEGYSNLLYVLLAAVVSLAVGRDGLHHALCGFNLLVLLGALWLFHRHVRRRLGAWPAGGAAVVFALTPAFWAWTASGLETVVVLALQIALWAVVDELESGETRSRLTALAAVHVLAVLTRADGFVLPAVTVAYFLLHRNVRLAWRAALPVAPVVALHFVWRLAYYGELLPNTYYAKVAGPLSQRLASALGQLYELALTQGLIVFLLALGGLLVAGLRSRRVPFGVFLPLSILAYWVWVGGDHFGERFLLVVYPLGLVALLELFAARLGRVRLVLLLLAVLLIQTRPLADDPRFAYSRDRYDGWITLGRHLGEHFPGRRLAVGAAGKIPYFSGLPTIDMRGLNDRHIAHLEVGRFANPGHDKTDLSYVLERRPDLIAAWIGPDFDMSLELEREVYLGAGYRLCLLVNVSRASRAENVIDVHGLPEARRRELIRQGYRFGVLERAR